MSHLVESLRDTVAGIVIIPLSLAWMFGGFAGAIYAAINDDLIDVVLSIFIPGYGAFYCIAQAF